MSTLSLEARPRALHGRHAVRLRRDGVIPAVVYGHRQDALSIETDGRTLERLWARAGRTTLIDLAIAGQKARKVLIREIQFSPRTGRPVHVDFFAPNLTVRTVADVSILLVGESPAAVLKLGQVLQLVSTVRVEALPADLPTHVEADLAALVEAEQGIAAGEIPLPPGVTLVGDPAEIVAKVSGRRGKAEMEDEAADAAAAAEAAEPAPDAGGGSEGAAEG